MHQNLSEYKDRKTASVLRMCAVGTKVIGKHRVCIAHTGFWGWEVEQFDGVVELHPNEALTVLTIDVPPFGTRTIAVSNDKVEYLKIIEEETIKN